MPETTDTLIQAVRREAERARFPIDTEVYARSGRDPNLPILFAGSLEAALCVVGRDLGKDEVRAGQPLIGTAGRAVRAGIVRARRPATLGDRGQPADDPELAWALDYALLTNLVPYKPPGNKAYSKIVRSRFRPFLERLLVDHWKGDRLITLGSEAFHWFKPYGNLDEFEAHGGTAARFEREFPCRLPGHFRPGADKLIKVYPLPHPSPLNRRWSSRFPSMLAERLAQVLTESATLGLSDRES